MTKKELAKIIIEEIKDLLRWRADALNFKSTYKGIEKILREADKQYVWLRLGDADDYHNFDTIDEVKADLEALGLKKDFKKCRKYGISNSEYKGLNYISLFWGDSEAQPLKPISDKELEYLNK